MALQISSQGWWEAESYTDSTPIPEQLGPLAGPHGIALVKAFIDGRTQLGWGLTPPRDSDRGFMPRYQDLEFHPKRAMHRYHAKGEPFAFVMRSLRVVCIDIDGKNGGLEYVGRLGALPITLAETSKSGNGYHVYYYVDEDWDAAVGYGSIPDQIGITQGVDIRGTGCVYHYPTQRWNGRPIVQLPDWLKEKLVSKQKQRQASAEAAKKITTLDEMERLMAHTQLLEDLAKPIPNGKRNSTLFAIGAQLMQAEVPDWETAIRDRAINIHLSSDEADKIVENIQRYGHTV